MGLTVDSPVLFSREQENKYDTNAILATTTDGRPIGHLSAEWATVYAPKMDAGAKYEGKIITNSSKVLMVKLMRTNSNKEIFYDIF